MSDATQLSYGQALLTKIPPEGTPEPPNDTSVLLGRLDLKLFAGAEADNAKAAVRLASDMGEFFMPFPGTRVNQETVPLDANGLTGVALVLRSEVHRHQQAQRPDLGRAWSARRRPRAPRAGSAHRNAGSWSGSARPAIRWTRRPPRRWPTRSGRGRRLRPRQRTPTRLRRRLTRTRRHPVRVSGCRSRSPTPAGDAATGLTPGRTLIVPNWPTELLRSGGTPGVWLSEPAGHSQ